MWCYRYTALGAVLGLYLDRDYLAAQNIWIKFIFRITHNGETAPAFRRPGYVAGGRDELGRIRGIGGR